MGGSGANGNMGKCGGFSLACLKINIQVSCRPLNITKHVTHGLRLTEAGDCTLSEALCSMRRVFFSLVFYWPGSTCGVHQSTWVRESHCRSIGCLRNAEQTAVCVSRGSSCDQQKSIPIYVSWLNSACSQAKCLRIQSYNQV
jgi:hypothetical protein